MRVAGLTIITRRSRMSPRGPNTRVAAVAATKGSPAISPTRQSPRGCPGRWDRGRRSAGASWPVPQRSARRARRGRHRRPTPPMKSGTDGTRAAISPGVRRMPMPMLLPTMTARPNASPRTWRRPGGRAGGSPAGELMVGVSSGCAKGRSSYPVRLIHKQAPWLPPPTVRDIWAPRFG